MISVLYVDDEQNLLEIARLFLEETGEFRVGTAISAQNALNDDSIRSYDAVVSDYQMPGMDGIAFLKAVRERFGDIPFILFTGRGREEVVIEAINNGADSYLQKGGDPEAQFAELAHRIRQAVRRRTAELDRIKSEDKFSRLFIANPSLEAIMDITTGELIDINDAFTRTTGYSRDDVMGKTVRDFNIFTDSADRERIAQALASEGIVRNFETKIRTKSGEIRTLDLTAQRIRIGERDILFSQAVDITERKRLETDLGRKHAELLASYEQLAAAEEELHGQYNELANGARQIRINEERLIMAQEVGRTGSWEYNIATNEIWGSAEGLHIFGYQRGAGNFPIEEIEACIPERERAHNALVGLITKGQEYNLEYAVNPADGSAPRIIHSVARLEKDASGKPIRVIGVIQDITERKQTELELRRSEEKYRLLTENSLDIIYSMDLEGKITHISPQVIRYGYTPEQLITHNISEVVAEEDLPLIREDIRTTVATERSTRTTFRLKGSPENTVWLEDNGTVIKKADGVAVGISGVLRDITERKRAEEALRQAHKKLHLLSGITRHDIGNQLMTLNGFVGLLHEKNTNPSLENYFSRITGAGRQITATIAFMKEYEKIGVHVPVWQLLGTVVNEAGKGILPGQVMLKNEIPASIEVFADRLIVKVFFNLLDNSIRHGQRVTGIRVSSRLSGNDLVVVWEDDGVGIPPEDKELIFGRGFGKNTGMGMFLAQEILSLTGITIRETGIPREGARFEIVVPRSAYRTVPER